MAAPAGQRVSSTPVGRGSPVFQNRREPEGYQPPTAAQGSPVPATSGPLDVLAQNKYYNANSGFLKYPTEVGETERFPHFLRFHINIPGKSSFESSFQQVGGLTRTDYNRSQFGGQLGGEADVFSGSAIAGGVIAGALYGATQVLTDLARNATDGTPKQEGPDLFGAALGAGGAAVVGATILANVDMTRKTKRLVQTIDLYVPDQVIMQQQNKYGEVSLTAALGMAGLAGQGAKAVGGSIKDALSKIGSAASSSLGKGAATASENPSILAKYNFDKNTLGGGGAVIESMATILGGTGKELGIVGEGIENVIMQSYGIAQNPQVEVLFETIDNRTFEFGFSFHPRNSAEAKKVLEIIRMFRFHAAPELAKGAGGRYFIPPSEFDIEYRFKPGKDESDVLNEALHKFATCVLTNIDVNYVGQSGQFATFKDGIPVNIEMRLQFKEVEIMHKDLIKAGY